MATIPELAPDLIAAGMTIKELRRDLRPREPAPPRAQPGIAPKRFRMVYKLILKGKPDDTIVRLASVPVEVVQAVRSQVEAVKAKLATLDPVTWDTVEPDTETSGSLP